MLLLLLLPLLWFHRRTVSAKKQGSSCLPRATTQQCAAATGAACLARGQSSLGTKTAACSVGGVTLVVMAVLWAGEKITLVLAGPSFLGCLPRAVFG